MITDHWSLSNVHAMMQQLELTPMTGEKMKSMK